MKLEEMESILNELDPCGYNSWKHGGLKPGATFLSDSDSALILQLPKLVAVAKAAKYLTINAISSEQKGAGLLSLIDYLDELEKE